MSIESSIKRGVTQFRYFIDNMGFMKGKRQSEEGRDLDLLYRIQPTCGVKFYDDYVRYGDAYATCIHVFTVPNALVRNWMFQVCNMNQAITTIDIKTVDSNEAKESLNKAINEYDSRLTDKNRSNKRSVEKETLNTYARLDALLDELSVLGNTLKELEIRIFLFARTYEELQNRIVAVTSQIDEDGYSTWGIDINGMFPEFRSFLISKTEQDKSLTARKGIPCPSNIAAFGLPHHFVGWKDPSGFRIGDTPYSAGHGAVVFDPYRLNRHRNSYDGVIVGDKGSGKSTTLKMLIEYQIGTGNKVRIIDVTSEFNDITEKYGGIVLKMDGTGGKLNPLQILRMDEDDAKNYMMHISKMGVMYQLKNPSATQDVVDLYKSLLKTVYFEKGVLCENFDGETIYEGITKLSPKAFPTFTDVKRVLTKTISRLEIEAQTKEASKIQIGKYLEIKSTIDDIVDNYGYIFDGHTSIGNLMDADLICFDIKAVSDMEPSIFDMQLFNVLTMAYDSCMTIGINMKKKYDNRQINLIDVVHHTIYIDECHKTINSTKIFAVRRMLDILRQDRKYFIGVWFATQNIADMFPNSNDISDELKTLFSLCQYKMIFKQDDSAVDLISKVLGSRITPYQLAAVPRFAKRECLLNIGLNTIQMTCKQLSESRLKYYGGGA